MAAVPRETTTLTDTVADDIRGRIYSGDLAPDEPLPSEAVLAICYGVSRATVRRCLRQLTHEGLLTSRPGTGYHVRSVAPLGWLASRPERDARNGAFPADTWSTGVREQGREPREDIDVAIIRAPARVADRLWLVADEPVVVRRRLRYVDGQPMLLLTSYYPQRLVRKATIACPDDALPGTHAVTESRDWVRRRDEIAIRMPTREESLKLALADGTPVAEHIRTDWAADNRPVRTQICVLPGDRNTIVYELPD